jgi:hypothetical protein
MHPERTSGVAGHVPIPIGHDRLPVILTDFYFPTASCRPSLSKKLSVVFDAPTALSRMNSVTNPPPSAICGNTTGVGAARATSAMGNVVMRKSLRSLFNERRVRAAKGVADVMSSTPVDPTKPTLPARAGLLCLWDFTCSWGAWGDCIFFETYCPVRQIFAVVSLTDDPKVLGPANRRDDYGVADPDGGPLISNNLYPGAAAHSVRE